MKTQMEALIHHFKIVTEGFAVPAGEVYQGSNRGMGRWATTWFPMGRPSLIACTCGIRRLQTCRRWR